MGIEIIDDFRLRQVEGGKVRLTIKPTMNPAGVKGKSDTTHDGENPRQDYDK